MATNIFPRYNGDYINIDGREGSLGGGPGGQDPSYVVELLLSPSQLKPQESAQLKTTVTKDGEPVPNAQVTFQSSNTAIGEVPGEQIMADQLGRVIFEVIAKQIGVTTITARYINPAGVLIQSNEVTLMVVTVDAAENYDATGYGRVVLSIESPFANALYARPQRLSHVEQARKFPHDTGLSRMTNYEAADIVFIPKWM